MLESIQFPDDGRYLSGQTYEPVQFYMEALIQSRRLDLLLGYFSSSAISVLAVGFAKFLSNGGEVRMVINHILSERDKSAILKGETGNVFDFSNLLNDFDELKKTLNNQEKHFFECLAWLIKSKKVQIKVIKPKGNNGIAHFKSGVFSDGINELGFKASCNFTASGLLNNLEELDAHCAWESQKESNWVKKQNANFDEFFSGKSDICDYIPFNDIEVAIVKEFGNKDLDELLAEETKLSDAVLRATKNKKLQTIIEKIQEAEEKKAREPRFLFGGEARDYQKEAYQNWINNGYKGIFAMATGTGKTITSLNCVLEEYRKYGLYRVVIVVPTIALIEQWKSECLKFNFTNIITVTLNDKWSNQLAFINTSSNFIDSSFAVIVTYASFLRPKFQRYFKTLPNDTVLVADEAHNLGSPQVSKLLPHIHLQKRIGLSATPSRKYDDLGNEIINVFFNDEHPYTYSYSMKQALDVGWLCQYKYYPHIVYLTDNELIEYKNLSKQLLKYFDTKTGAYKNVPEVERLLLARKRIIHKAVNKLDVFKKIVKVEFTIRKNLDYTLIYVPEGNTVEYDNVEELSETDDDTALINEFTRIVSNTDDSIMVKQYTSRTERRSEVIKDFQDGNINVLTSMKCLDEGVDIPRSELAIFCSSTGNPRQFIQRRGRILRLHKDKKIAVIHDLVVIPSLGNDDEYSSMERNIVSKELERVVDFSQLATNKIDTYNALKEVLEYYNLNLNDFETE